MGWWKTGNGQTLVGDRPVDVLGLAHEQVILEYQAAFGRRPAIAEWEELLMMTLCLSGEEYRSSDESIPSKIIIQVDALSGHHR